MKRPLIQKGVAELEVLFDQRRDDPEFLKTLVAELSERKTQRAHDLKARAVQASAVDRLPFRPVLRNDPPEKELKRASAAQSPAEPFVRSPERFTVPQDSGKGVSPIRDRPPITNHATDVLSAWTAMEVLSPPTYRKPDDLVGGDRYRIALIENGALPWENGGEKSRPNQKLYYQIVLGSIDMEAAVTALLEVYTDTRAERPQARGEAVLATVMVDRDGRPVDAEPVSVSSFGWGIPVALSGRLHDLRNWPETESRLLEGVTKRIIVEDKDGNPLPLTRKSIQTGFDWLVGQLALDAQFIKPPSFVVRSYQYFKIQDPPESILLNSFFLDDLANAQSLIEDGKATSNLKRYLGVIKPQSRLNLMKDNAALTSALEPKKFPLGSWPAADRNPLALLQQCAVNLAMHDLKTEGILAVNGPPGTGKTTLLRDAVAAIITKRAEVMCSFDDPEGAFVHAGQKLRKGNAFVHLYRLSDKLRGYEIIVASSNNKAVENVSAELPGIDAIAADASNLRYFKTVSDKLLDRQTWGVIAAVLGNARNRSEFRQSFWWDEDVGMQRYLQEASGNPQFIVEKTGSATTQRKPRVIIDEDAPEDHDDALRRWKKAKARFKKAAADAKAAMADLQTIHELISAIPQTHDEIAKLDIQGANDIQNVDRVRKQYQQALAASQGQQRECESVAREVDRLKLDRPGFWSRLFGNATYRRWQDSYLSITSRHTQAKTELTNLERSASLKQSEKTSAETALHKSQAAKTGLQARLEQQEDKLASLKRDHLGVGIAGDFFELRHSEKQRTAPWLDIASARLRNDVFEAAIAVHRAFVDAAAKPMRHNLNVLLDGFGTRSLGSPEKDALIPHIWSTLFLLVPVVSTTFASVSRMFAKIGPSEFGWLLIDEAGQALPQAAVGALMRTQRAIVVGDPIQIEPVVVLPNQLTEAICGQFGIEPTSYNAPGASVQTLSDAATEYYGTFETKFGTREVGVPLLVHRRCAEPMFSISNSIAYENLMVQAKTAKPSSIRDVLGPSKWIDVVGSGQEKWCPREGEEVLKLLQQLRDAGCKPDFYVVTPFVVVQDRLRSALRSHGLLEGWVENPYAWVYERVGTVHTVQGREAEAVFFVLGAPDAQQRGARGWAGGRPNLLNVAATRAKEALYVVGNRALWKEAGVFQSLDTWMG